MRFTAAIVPEDGVYVARCLEVEVASHGDSIEEAIRNLGEALELYFEDEEAIPCRPTPIIAPIELALPAEAVEVSAEEEAELLERIAEIDRGEFIEPDQLFSRRRKPS